MKELIESYLEENQVIGAAGCVIDQGNIHFFTHGKKSVNDDTPVTEDTLFEIGSITKVFTTLALMDMVKKNEVKLNDPIEQFLPGLRIPQLDGYRITLGHLATHTSGLPQLPENFQPKDPDNQYADYTVDRLYDFLNRHTLRRIPGKTLVYSNIGIGLLGHILCLKARKSYEELIVDLIANQLGMSETSVTLTPAMEQRMSTGHHLGKAVERWSMGALPGEGALRSHAKDMSKFLAANMGLMQTTLNDTLKACHQAFYKTENVTVGLGWILQNGIIMHSGGTNGYRSFIGFNPQTNKGTVILSNSRDEWPDDLGKVLIDPNYKKLQINRELARDPDYLKQFAGSYEASLPNGTKQELKIEVVDTHLAVLFKNGSTGMIYPERFGQFGIRGFADGKIHFSFSGEGTVTSAQAIHTSGKTLWEAVPNSTK